MAASAVPPSVHHQACRRHPRTPVILTTMAVGLTPALSRSTAR